MGHDLPFGVNGLRRGLDHELTARQILIGRSGGKIRQRLVPLELLQDTCGDQIVQRRPDGPEAPLTALLGTAVQNGRITVADQQRGRSRGHHAGSHDTYLTLRHSRSSSDWYKIPSLYHTIRRRSNGIFHIDLWKTRRCRRVFHSKCRFWPADQYIRPALPYRFGAFSHKSALSPIWSRSPADSSSSRARTSAGTCAS